MRNGRDLETSISRARWLLADAATGVALLRLDSLLTPKFSADQPRVPAGQPGGGRWISDALADPETTGSIGETPAEAAPKSGEAQAERTVTEDGSRVLTIRIRSRPRPFDEQSTVVAPDGESRVFETTGATQTIRDGDTGEVLGRSTFTTDGVVAEPTVQPALFGALAPLARAAGLMPRAARSNSRVRCSPLFPPETVKAERQFWECRRRNTILPTTFNGSRPFGSEGSTKPDWMLPVRGMQRFRLWPTLPQPVCVKPGTTNHHRISAIKSIRSSPIRSSKGAILI